MKFKFLISFSCSLFLLWSCSTTPPPPTSIPNLIIANEGNFSDGNGSLTIIDLVQDMSTNNAFNTANGVSFGGIIQTMKLHNNQLYIVGNVSDKIEIVNDVTLERIQMVDLSGNSPSSMEVISKNMIYVTTLFKHSVLLLNLEDETTISKSITVGKNPRDIIKVNDYAYVANSGFGRDSTITVIDINTHTAMDTIKVGRGPHKFIYDGTQYIWILCSGYTAYDADFNPIPEDDVDGSIHVLDTQTRTISQVIASQGSPRDATLDVANNILYVANKTLQVINTKTYTMTTELSTEKYSTVLYDNVEDMLYAGKNLGYTQNGLLYRYVNGAFESYVEVGIAPRTMVLRY